MLNSLYKLPKALFAVLVIGGGIVFMLISDPPRGLCDSQLEHFEKLQKGLFYEYDKSPKDNILLRKKAMCQAKSAPGVCYDYFAQLRKAIRVFRALSEDCAKKAYARSDTRAVLKEALALMTALAWREEALTGRARKYNWLTRTDIHLFCKIKNKYVMYYGLEAYRRLESEILSLLPVQQKIQPKFLIRKTLLSESCAAYR